MQHSRDSSVWRTLAVAFGDGLAFGVGVTLTRSAAHIAASRNATPELHPGNGWSGEVEQRSRLKPKAADAVVTAIDGRFAELGSRMDRRLAELETRIQAELDALDAQDHSLAEGIESRIDGLRGEITAAVAAQRESTDADMRALRAQMTALHKEFAGTLARLVDEQIAQTIADRVQAVEERLRETIRQECRQDGRDREMAELRERVDSQERSVVNLVMALGQSCLRAVERISPAEPAKPPAATADAAPQESSEEAAGDLELPGFARTRPRKPLWRPPIVPSFLVATGSLLLLHYL